MAELKWWMMQLIAREDYVLQLSNLGLGMGKTQIFNLLIPSDLTNLIFLCRYGWK